MDSGDTSVRHVLPLIHRRGLKAHYTSIRQPRLDLAIRVASHPSWNLKRMIYATRSSAISWLAAEAIDVVWLRHVSTNFTPLGNPAVPKLSEGHAESSPECMSIDGNSFD